MGWIFMDFQPLTNWDALPRTAIFSVCFEDVPLGSSGEIIPSWGLTLFFGSYLRFASEIWKRAMDYSGLLDYWHDWFSTTRCGYEPKLGGVRSWSKSQRLGIEHWFYRNPNLWTWHGNIAYIQYIYIYLYLIYCHILPPTVIGKWKSSIFMMSGSDFSGGIHQHWLGVSLTIWQQDHEDLMNPWCQMVSSINPLASRST